MNVIEVKNFTKYYGNYQAISNISFKVKPKTITSFVGKNGAGKSTTINCLMNSIFPSSGELKILGQDVTKENYKLKEIVSFMSSDVSYYENLTGAELIGFAGTFKNNSVRQAFKLARYFELDLKKKYRTLSLGNKKKLALVLTLMKKAKLYIFDEPTNGLDPIIQERFFKVLKKLRENGATIFLSSHNLFEVQKYSDAIIIIQAGQITKSLDLKDLAVKNKLLVTYQVSKRTYKKTIFKTELNACIKHLATLKLENLEIKAASFIDDFIEYYAEGDNYEN